MITSEKGVRYYAKDVKYIGVLKYYFKDYPDIQKKVDRTQYTHESMIKLVKAYHDLVCTSDQVCTIFESKDIHDKYKIKFSPYIGYNYLSDYELYSDFGVNLKNKTSKHYPVIGGQAAIYFPRISQSFSIDLDISVSRLKAREDVESNGSNNPLFSTREASSLVGFLKIGPGYTYYKGKVRPKIEAGFTVIKIFDPKVELTYYQSGAKSDEGEIRSTGSGFYVAAGVDFKIFNNNFIFIKATYDKYVTGINGSNLSYIGGRIGYTF